MAYDRINLPGLQTQAQAAIYTMLDQIDAAAPAGELVLPSTPDYTSTVTVADDTSIWKGINVPGWGRCWFLTSTALSTALDGSGVLDDANIPGSELTIGDRFFVKADTDGTQSDGIMILKNFTAGTPATNIDLSNITSDGLANTD